MSIDYDGRVFRSVSNTGSGEVDTRFHYRQEGDVVWATYRGGGVKLGSLVAKVWIAMRSTCATATSTSPAV